MISRVMIKRALCAAMILTLCLPCALAESLSSDEILEVEQALYSLGYHDNTFDGTLDDHTVSAIRAFQTANGLEATGEIDEETLEMLYDDAAVTCHEYLTALAAQYDEAEVLQSGSMGTEVSALQSKLRELGYYSGSSDGVFGDATQQAICRFQIANGLEETGVADRATQIRLYEGEPLSWTAFLESVQCGVGDSGQNVRRLQRALRSLGYFQGECSGTYGDMTQQAVMQFQAANDLEETGTADVETCTVLYSGAAVSLEDPDVLRSGDSGDSVTELQTALSEKGYYTGSITGDFGASTETALRLFQLANGLPSTGEADEEVLAKLQSDDAVTLEEAAEDFAEQLSIQDDSAQTVAGSVALRLRGQAFEADGEEAYRGFTFVQYVCVTAGIPLTSAEDLMDLFNETVDDISSLESGDIVAIITSADGGVTLGVSSGGGRVIYATSDSAYVLETDLANAYYTVLLCWDMGASA